MFIGVDVGGTNSDCVIIHNGQVVAWNKEITSSDITTGVKRVIERTLAKLNVDDATRIQRISLGTTHFLNAVIQKHGLARVSVIRLCGPASVGLPPFVDIPEDLREHIMGDYFFVDGGYYVNGKESLPLKPVEIAKVAQTIKKSGLRNVVLTGIYSHINPRQEEQVADLLREAMPGVSITLSHTIGHNGLLERENASILNECLKPLCSVTLKGLHEAIQELNLNCPLYLTQNDGTLVSLEQCLAFPVCTFASGPTNSMRGAAFLSQASHGKHEDVQNAIVADIGGTSTDVGQLVNGFPREAGSRVEIGGVLTNFRMPQLLSIGLGGGSLVELSPEGCVVGPLSVGSRLLDEAQCMGGPQLTTTDVMVMTGMLKDLGNPDLVSISAQQIEWVQDEIRHLLENIVDQMKISSHPIPLLIVGGGGILVQPDWQLAGISQLIFPEHYQVANAVGAALAQVSGTFDQIILDTPREKALQRAKKEATQAAYESGAAIETINILDVAEIPVSYMPGNAVRYTIKAVGDLDPTRSVNPKFLEHPTSTEELFQGMARVDFDPPHGLTPGSDTLNGQSVYQGHPYSNPSDPHTWILNEYDVDAIAIGAAILGCGGGGSSYLGKLRAKLAIRSGQVLKVIQEQKLDEGWITTVAFFGAPTCIIEKLMNGNEGLCSVRDMENLLQYKSVAIGSCEIGGMNSLEPLIVGGAMNLPVLDADGMGRAFPELQMYLPLIKKHSPTPAIITDEKECSIAITKSESAKQVEDILRAHVVGFMGCSGVMALNPIHTEKAGSMLISGSYAKAWTLGHAVLEATKVKSDPVKAILHSVEGSKIIGSGKISDLKRETVSGFAKGFLTITPLGRDSEDDGILIDFQNENLIAQTVGNEVLATTPNLISIIESSTGLAVETECLKYGLRVSVLVMPAPLQLLAPDVLEAVGPPAFGYSGMKVL